MHFLVIFLLSLAEAQQKALDHSHKLAASKWTVAAAEEQWRSQRATLMPSVEGFARLIYSTADGELTLMPTVNLAYALGTLWQAGVQVTQPLYMGGKLRAAVSLRRVAVDVANQRRELTRQETLLEVTEAYARALCAQQRRTLAETYLAAIAQVAHEAESALKHGVVVEHEAMEARAELSQAELQVLRATNAATLARANLARLIGEPVATPLEASPEDPYHHQLIFDPLSLDLRPEISISSAALSAAQKEERIARAEMLPQFAAQAGYSYVHGLRLSSATLFDEAQFAAALSLTVPLYHFGERSHKLRAAQARVRQAEEELRDAQDLVALEQQQATLALAEALAEESVCEERAQQSLKALAAAKRQHELGALTLARLLEAHTTDLNRQTALIEAHLAALLQRLRTAKALGVL